MPEQQRGAAGQPVPHPPHLAAALDAAAKGTLSIVALIEAAEQLTQGGDAPAAAQLYRTWIAHDRSPALHVAHFNLGVVLAGLREHAGAEQSYRAALALAPGFLQAHLNLGTVLEQLGRPEEALAEWRATLAHARPDSADDKPLRIHALNNLGRLLETRKDDAGAEAALGQSLALDPKQPEAIAHWVHLRQKLCMWPAFKPLPGASVEDLTNAASALALLAESVDPAVQLAAAQRYVAKKVLPLQEPLAPAEGYDHRRLRVGYLSGDFCNHPVSILTAELYPLHDRSRFEVYAFSWSRQDGSALRARVVGAMDHYIRIDDLDDAAAARLIREHEIDILVDLQGLTLGTRHDILSWRPAPVQVTWLGFPGTTALPAIDYVIADRFVLPEALTPWFTEKPLYMPDCFQINDRQRAIGTRPTRAACGLPEDAFVFCSFNSTFKITPQVFAAWMEILRRTDNSVLWLIADSEPARAQLQEHARQAGVDPQRLYFAQRVAPENYLARYQVADLFLDTNPFNAGTTASDALWAGLPLVTCVGATFGARMAGTLLHAVDLPQLVTYSLDEYVALAVELAADPARIAAMKRQLETRRLDCALFDSPRLVRALEGEFERVARRAAPAAPSAKPHGKPHGKQVRLFQWAAPLEPGYAVLPNPAPGRPDWHEYWPMRQFLLGEQLDDDTYYGFFAPDFAALTGLSHQGVHDFIDAALDGADAAAAPDVFTFSPQPEMGSFFLNVFEQLELTDPGFGAATDAFLAASGRPLAVGRLVMDSRQIVFRNFFVARPAFWRAWLGLTEQLFACCEGPDTPLKAALLHAATPDAPARKVLLAERIASLLLTVEPQWRVRAYETFRCTWSPNKLGAFKLEAVISDALKMAMREQGFAAYASAFNQIRDRLR